jgi:transposase
MHIEDHHTTDQLAELIRAEPRARIARRLSAVRLALLGHTAPDVARQVLLSERQVRTWVARYNDGSVEALADRPGRGRKKPLTDDQERRLKARLCAGPTDTDGGVCALRGEDVRRILEEEFGVVRCLQAVYDLLHRLGFECLRPRPKHPKADPGAVAEFKKGFPSGSPGSKRFTPSSESRSGSRTRRGSGRRGR